MATGLIKEHWLEIQEYVSILIDQNENMNAMSRTVVKQLLSISLMLLTSIILLSGASAEAQEVMELGRSSVDYGVTTISPKEAGIYKANYLDHIKDLRQAGTTSSAEVEKSEDLEEAIRRQAKRRNSEPLQVDVMVIYGLDKTASSSVIYQMVYPVDANMKIIPFTKSKVFVVGIPVTSSMRLPTNCPPYCD